MRILKVRYTQTNIDLNAHLKEQIQFLTVSAESYDKGNEWEAKRLAVAIRTLLHDTAKSKSLLAQINGKSTLFYNTANDCNPDKYFPPLMGLTMIKGESNSIRLCAPLSTYISRWKDKDKIPFSEWWNQIVIYDTDKNTLTRKDLILKVANTDGGAHIDPELDADYAALTRLKSLGITRISIGLPQDVGLEVTLASIRQITYEVILSLKDDFPQL